MPLKRIANRAVNVMRSSSFKRKGKSMKRGVKKKRYWICLLAMLLVCFAPAVALAGMGQSVDKEYYGKIWRGRSAAYEYQNPGESWITEDWRTWTKITNTTAPQNWLRNRTKAYRNLDFYKDQVVVNTTTAHSAGDAIENKILASAWSADYYYCATYSTHALYRGSIGYDDGYFETVGAEDWDYS